LFRFIHFARESSTNAGFPESSGERKSPMSPSVAPIPNAHRHPNQIGMYRGLSRTRVPAAPMAAPIQYDPLISNQLGRALAPESVRRLRN